MNPAADRAALLLRLALGALLVLRGLQQLDAATAAHQPLPVLGLGWFFLILFGLFAGVLLMLGTWAAPIAALAAIQFAVTAALHTGRGWEVPAFAALAALASALLGPGANALALEKLPPGSSDDPPNLWL